MNNPEPWSYSHFTDTALSQATARICARASSGTRSLYARGQGRSSGENWVVQWMLYHICRYRDSRNSRGRSPKVREDDDLKRGKTSGMFDEPPSIAPFLSLSLHHTLWCCTQYEIKSCHIHILIFRSTNQLTSPSHLDSSSSNHSIKASSSKTSASSSGNRHGGYYDAARNSYR